jgi:VanZ family protein
MLQRRRAAIAVGLAAIYLGGMFLLTHVPASNSSQAGGADKLVHALLYAGLAVLLCAAVSLFRRPSVAVALGVVLVVAVYGALDEWTQTFVPSRTADFWDWVADVVGAALGVAGFFLVRRFLWQTPQQNG